MELYAAQASPPCRELLGEIRGGDVAAFIHKQFGITECTDACPFARWVAARPPIIPGQRADSPPGVLPAAASA